MSRSSDSSSHSGKIKPKKLFKKFLADLFFVIIMMCVRTFKFCLSCYGECHFDIFGLKNCDCSKSSHGGKFCTVDKCLDFDETVCKNDGFCNADSGTAVCDCSWSSYGGEYCTVEKCSGFDESVCKNNGFCNADSGTAGCDCSNSIYDGTFCKIDKCEHDNPCKNGGICSVNSGINTQPNVICDCYYSGYDGPYCTPSICDGSFHMHLDSEIECHETKILNLRGYTSGDYEWDIRYEDNFIKDVPYLGDLIYVEEINLSGNKIRQLTSRTFENNISLIN